MKTTLTLLLALSMTLSAFGTSKNTKDLPTTLPFESTGEGPYFYIDYTNYSSTDDKTFVEFYMQIGYRELQFIKSGDRFQAEYDILFEIFDAKDNLVEQYKNLDHIKVNEFDETIDPKKARISSPGFILQPGTHTLKVSITDLETERTSSIDEKFEALNFEEDALSISEVQLSQKIEYTEESGPYIKNKRYIEPMAVRTFAHGLADINLYFEIYNLVKPGEENSTNYTAQFVIHNDNLEKVADFKRTHKKPGDTAAHSIKLPVDSFFSGKYLLTIRIIDNDTDAVVESTKEFTVVDWPSYLSQASVDYQTDASD